MPLALFASLLFAAAAQDATPAAAPPSPAAAPIVIATQKPKKPRMICHDEADIGSVLTHRVCRTPEQISAESAQSCDAVQSFQLNATHMVPPSH